MRRIILRFGLVVAFLSSLTYYAYAAQTITARKVGQGPLIDGSGKDPVWEKAQALITYDKIADINITLKAVYTDKEIFFLVTFFDPDESRIHKEWVWDKDSRMYKPGPGREDAFVFKWNMGVGPVDLSVYSDDPYMTDIWFWKACRTDPSGFADDKMDLLNSFEMPKTMKIISKSGKVMYLQRLGDTGEPAFKDTLPVEYTGDVVLNFRNQVPTLSRADIKARGIWSDGKWTIEFARALNTGKADDLQFIPGKSYQFGVSRYEIAARAPEATSTQPLYGSGDINEDLMLQFGE